jgi:hypothetical protein
MRDPIKQIFFLKITSLRLLYVERHIKRAPKIILSNKKEQNLNFFGNLEKPKIAHNFCTNEARDAKLTLAGTVYKGKQLFCWTNILQVKVHGHFFHTFQIIISKIKF